MVESWEGFLGGSKCSSSDRGGEFSVEIIDVSRVIDELEPGTRNIHTRGNACARTSRTRKVVGRCLVYRGGGSRIERRATASHWPPIGRSGGGSLQSSIQAVIG